MGTAVASVHRSDADADQLADLSQKAKTRTELWNVFLMLALFCLVAEMIIEKRWRPESV